MPSHGGSTGNSGISTADGILTRLIDEATVYNVPRIQAGSFSAVEFYREYVAPRKPCIICGAMEGWTALSKWDADYLTTAMGDSEVTVAATPNGRADALTEVEGKTLFMRPDELTLPFSAFAARLRDPEEKAVLYAQKQNDSFRTEYTPLHADVPGNIASLGEEVFGTPPDAVNFWMGGDATLSSMHKDPYENLYSVVRGTKLFTLLPPWEASLLPYTPHQEGVWRQGSDGVFTVEQLESEVRWVAVDPNDPNAAEAHPQWARAHPLRVEVGAGETLFLPSTWYHEVGQRGDASDGLTVAVNYWFDIHYDTNYWLLEAVRRLSSVSKGDPLSDDEGDGLAGVQSAE